MRWWQRFLVGLGTFGLFGCVTVQDSKSVVVPPSNGPTVVTAKAIAQCQDFFFVVRCELQVWQESDPPAWKQEQVQGAVYGR